MEGLDQKQTLATAVKKILLLIITFSCLIYVTVLLWQHRFVYANTDELDLSYTPSGIVKSEKGSITKNEKGDTVLHSSDVFSSIEYQWEKMPSYHYFQVLIDAETKDIVTGKQVWENARMEFHWINLSVAQKIRMMHMWSAYGTKSFGVKEYVAPTNYWNVPAKLVIANLATSGEFIIHSVKVRGVNNASWLKPTLIAVLVIWMCWLVVFFRCFSNNNFHYWRHLLSACIVIIFTWSFCLPGPWLPLHPIGHSFLIPYSAAIQAPPPAIIPVPQAEQTAPAPITPLPVPQAAPAAPPAPKVANQTTELYKNSYSDLISRILGTMPYIKKSVHYLIFLTLAMLLGFLNGKKPALLFCCIFAIMTELCEYSLGFGSGIDDVYDIILDIVFALLGLYIIDLTKKLFRKNQIPISSIPTPSGELAE